MKIIKFETKDHPILGNCVLDFSKNKTPSNIILMAGSNGSGKTTILNEIFNFITNPGLRRLDFDIKMSFFLSPEEVSILKMMDGSIDNVLEMDITRAIDANFSWALVKMRNSIGGILSPYQLANKDEFKKLFKCVFSTAEINFSNSDIQSITAKDIDENESPKEKSGLNVFHEIAQLLVDIKAQDNQDAFDWQEKNKGKTLEVEPQNRRINRFKKAFDFMIEGKKFCGVKNEGNRKKVYFTDSFGNEIDISALSSGEKQIVFRAGYLLKNIGSLSGGIILIDEPEISLHPLWQEKYIQFIKNVFSDEKGEMQTQVIIATHSPFIIQNKNILDEKIVVLERNEKNIIESLSPKFHGYVDPEQTFSTTILNENQLLMVEGKSDKQILLIAWKKIFPDKTMPFDIQWANEPYCGGASWLQKHLKVLPQHSKSKILGLFDADTRGLNDYNGTQLNNGADDFKQNNEINSLKICKKVGVTYLPVCQGREICFNKEPQFSTFILEMYFEDAILQKLGIANQDKIKLGNDEIIKIKDNHALDDSAWEGLEVGDFEKMKILFEHIKNCFSKIN